MHTTRIERWVHSHDFGQAERSVGEKRTVIVALLTAVFMVVELAAGAVYGSMALLADGMHMGSHAVALGISVAAYVYARRHAADERFSFGTGKVNALGGYTGALLLAGFALLMAYESIDRVFNPVAIVFDNALIVAVLGLLVNGASVALLGVHHHDHDHHHHDHDHDHDHHHHHHHDHNLRSAYLHVLADALTSVAAIIALIAGKYFGLSWLDPVMGLAGSLLVGRWAFGLLRDSSKTLLDHQAAAAVRDEARRCLEGDSDDRVTDLHIWDIGPGRTAACVTLVSHEPQSPEAYKQRLAPLAIDHITIEVHRCESG